MFKNLEKTLGKEDTEKLELFYTKFKAALKAANQIEREGKEADIDKIVDDVFKDDKK